MLFQPPSSFLHSPASNTASVPQSPASLSLLSNPPSLNRDSNPTPTSPGMKMTQALLSDPLSSYEDMGGNETVRSDPASNRSSSNGSNKSPTQSADLTDPTNNVLMRGGTLNKRQTPLPSLPVDPHMIKSNSYSGKEPERISYYMDNNRYSHDYIVPDDKKQNAIEAVSDEMYVNNDAHVYEGLQHEAPLYENREAKEYASLHNQISKTNLLGDKEKDKTVKSPQNHDKSPKPSNKQWKKIEEKPKTSPKFPYKKKGEDVTKLLDRNQKPKLTEKTNGNENDNTQKDCKIEARTNVKSLISTFDTK